MFTGKKDRPPSYYKNTSPVCYLDRDLRFNKFLGTGIGTGFGNQHRRFNSFKKVGAGGIIINSENQLLIVKGTSKWSLPKGHLEPGEKYHECAMREIKEEANLKIHLEVTDRYIDVKKCVYFIIVLNETGPINLTTNDPQEISEVRWANIEEIKDLDCNRQLDYVINRWSYIQSIIQNTGKRLIRYPIRQNDSDDIDYCAENVYFVPDFKSSSSTEAGSDQISESEPSS